MIVREYNYRCKDNSILTPYLRDYLVQPLLVLVPRTIPANIITIVSNSFIYMAMAMAYYFGPGFKWNFIIIPVLILIYLVGDHLDGMQAKKTQTSSALGEFCDHFLDAFNNGLLIIILLYLFQIDNKTLIIYLIVSSYLGHAGVFYNQFKTGWLIFEKFGSLEAVTLSMVLILIAGYSPLYEFLLQDIYGWSIVEYILIISSIGGIITFIRMLIDSKAISLKFILFIAVWIAAAFLMMSVNEMRDVYVFLILYSSNYIGALMHAHLVDGKERYPELLSIFALTIVVFSPLSMGYVFYITIYLLLRTIYLIARAFYPLRQYWVWVNPEITIEQ